MPTIETSWEDKVKELTLRLIADKSLDLASLPKGTTLEIKVATGLPGAMLVAEVLVWHKDLGEARILVDEHCHMAVITNREILTER